MESGSNGKGKGKGCEVEDVVLQREEQDSNWIHVLKG